MSLNNTVKNMGFMLTELVSDLAKAHEKGNKAASQRVRTLSVKFSKLCKLYRKLSVASEKKQAAGKKAKKSTRKKLVKKAAKKAVGKVVRKKVAQVKKKAVKRKKAR